MTCGQGQSPPYFFHLVLATSFLVPARRHTREHYWKVLQETLQQTDLRTLGKQPLGLMHTPVRQPTSQSPPGAQEQTDLQCRGWGQCHRPRKSWSLLSVSFLPVGWDTDPTCGSRRVTCKVDHIQTVPDLWAPYTELPAHRLGSLEEL